jgi:hypothetical protein
VIVPDPGSLWLDLRSFRTEHETTANRYVIVLGPAADEGYLRVISWWDTLGGRATTRRDYTLNLQYFQPKKDGSWKKRDGYRPARREPKYGRPEIEEQK